MTSIQSECDNKLLNKISEKLLLDLSDRSKLNKKGFEYLRLLKVKNGAGLANMSDSCAVVLCLNLAAETLNCGFDKSLAIKIASVTKRNYNSLYHTVQKVLGLDRPLTVQDLCIKLECSQISQLAQRLLDRYVRNREEGTLKCPPIDLTHPMYACSAVLAACRHKKVRVKRDLLLGMCRVKAKDLDKLASELATLVEQTEKQPNRKRGHHLLNMIEDMIDTNETQAKIKIEDNEEEKREGAEESFEDWKKRLLAEAGNM